MPVRQKIRTLLSKSDRASAFSSSFLARNHIDTNDPNYASSIASYADYTYNGQQPNEVPNIEECMTTQESEILVKKFWGDMLACYYPMSTEDQEVAVKQAARDCKVNCIHKGDNLHESNTESSAFIYTGSERGRKRMLKKHSKRELKHGGSEAPNLTEATAGPVVDGRARHMLMLISDGSQDSLRALHHCISIIESPETDHILIYTPWNETLPHAILEHHIQRSQKSIIGEHDSETLLKAKLRDAACAISHQFADVLEHERPDIDYTLLVPGTDDPASVAAIIAAKYTVEWIVVGKNEVDEKTGRRYSDYFGSDHFISRLQTIAGSKLILV